jgi:NAD+ kinase
MIVNPRPLELVFVRHGQSEGNVANEAAENGDTSFYTEEFKLRHSSTWDLTSKGIEQAKTAGKWITENINGGKFDAYYCSTYRRARKTAGYLGLPGAQWNVRDYIREHDWGNLDVMTDAQRREKFPDVMKKRDINKYYFAAPGGESLADVVIRVRVGILTTLYRDLPNKRGIVVSHGNVMWPIRILMEGWLPEQFQAIRDLHDPKDKINNCQIFQYSRIHPKSGEVTERFEWMRSVCPWDSNVSGNEWRRVEHRKYLNEELVGM